MKPTTTDINYFIVYYFVKFFIFIISAVFYLIKNIEITIVKHSSQE